MSLFQTFSGNSGKDQLVKHVLMGPPAARAVRFQPIHFSTRKALRVEVYGIKTPTGTLSCCYGDITFALLLLLLLLLLLFLF